MHKNIPCEITWNHKASCNNWYYTSCFTILSGLWQHNYYMANSRAHRKKIPYLTEIKIKCICHTKEKCVNIVLIKQGRLASYEIFFAEKQEEWGERITSKPRAHRNGFRWRVGREKKPGRAVSRGLAGFPHLSLKRPSVKQTRSSRMRMQGCIQRKKEERRHKGPVMCLEWWKNAFLSLVSCPRQMCGDMLVLQWTGYLLSKMKLKNKNKRSCTYGVGFSWAQQSQSEGWCKNGTLFSLYNMYSELSLWGWSATSNFNGTLLTCGFFTICFLRQASSWLVMSTLNPFLSGLIQPPL